MKHRIALAVGALFAALLLAEGVLRALDYQPDVLALFEPRSGTGFKLQPDLDVSTTVRGRDVRITTNSLGLRGPEPDATRSRQRVVFLGDSFTFGLWASSDADTFVAQVGEQLGVEAINAGVPGYGYGDMRLALEQDVVPLKPYLVVLVTYNGNDILDSFLGTDRYRVTGNGALEQDRDGIARKVPADVLAATPVPGGRFVDRSPLLRLARGAARAIAPSREPAHDPGTAWTSDLFWSRTNLPPWAADAKAAAIQELAALDQACRDNEIFLAVVALPYAQQVTSPELFGAEHDIDLPMKDVQAIATKGGRMFLDLRPPMTAAGGELYLPGEGHLTDVGHTVVAAEITAFLKRTIFTAGD